MSENTATVDSVEERPNASQIGLTTGVMYGLYKNGFAPVPVFLSILLLLPLGEIAARGYSWPVFGLVAFIALRESLGVVEYAHLHNDNLIDDLRKLAAKTNLWSSLVLLLLIGATFLPGGMMRIGIASSVVLGVVAATCAPLFGIAGMNYLFGASKVDTDKISTLNKYASMSAGIICSLSFFLIKNPTSLKMLVIMCIVSFFSFLLLKKTASPEITAEDIQQTRNGATIYTEPTLNFGYFMILFAAVAVLLFYLASNDAGVASAFIDAIKGDIR